MLQRRCSTTGSQKHCWLKTIIRRYQNIQKFDVDDFETVIQVTDIFNQCDNKSTVTQTDLSIKRRGLGSYGATIEQLF